MMADVADFSEWRNHRRATAVIFSAIIFGLKAGLGIGGAIGGYLLSAYGYVPNAEQSGACAARHPDDREPLSGHRVRAVRRVPRVLSHRQDDRSSRCRPSSPSDVPPS